MAPLTASTAGGRGRSTLGAAAPRGVHSVDVVEDRRRQGLAHRADAGIAHPGAAHPAGPPARRGQVAGLRRRVAWVGRRLDYTGTTRLLPPPAPPPTVVPTTTH